jgi:conjugative transfer region protein (TIGR03748 family)
MRPCLPSFLAARKLRTFGLLSTISFLVVGCVTTEPHQTQAQAAIPENSIEISTLELIPLARYGRYTLVELAPAAAQRDLLLQVIDVAIPDTLHASVGDAIRHVLLRSGYQLCEGHDANALLTLPLPVAHYRLGPVVLLDALLTLAGPAWDLQIDESRRQVCFTAVLPDVPEPPQPPLPATIHQAETLPSAGEGRP